MSFELGDGWYHRATSEHVSAFIRGAADRLEVTSNVTVVFDETGATGSIAESPEAFMRWLRTRRSLEVRPSTRTTVDAKSAIQIDARVEAGVDGFTDLFEYPSDVPTLGARYTVPVGHRIRFVLIPIEDTLVVISVDSPEASFEPFWTGAVASWLESLRFE
jgi:hypothetical protein